MADATQPATRTIQASLDCDIMSPGVCFCTATNFPFFATLARSNSEADFDAWPKKWSSSVWNKVVTERNRNTRTRGSYTFPARTVHIVLFAPRLAESPLQSTSRHLLWPFPRGQLHIESCLHVNWHRKTKTRMEPRHASNYPSRKRGECMARWWGISSTKPSNAHFNWSIVAFSFFPAWCKAQTTCPSNPLLIPFDRKLCGAFSAKLPSSGNSPAKKEKLVDATKGSAEDHKPAPLNGYANISCLLAHQTRPCPSHNASRSLARSKRRIACIRTPMHFALCLS